MSINDTLRIHRARNEQLKTGDRWIRNTLGVTPDRWPNEHQLLTCMLRSLNSIPSRRSWKEGLKHTIYKIPYYQTKEGIILSSVKLNTKWDGTLSLAKFPTTMHDISCLWTGYICPDCGKILRGGRACSQVMLSHEIMSLVNQECPNHFGFINTITDEQPTVESNVMEFELPR